MFVFHSSYFVSWKRSPRKGPRPGTRKGINRAAAWRACERPLRALLVDHLVPDRGSELWLLNTANRRETYPRPGPDTLATERFGRPPAASWGPPALFGRLKSCSKRHSKTDQILMPFQHRFWSVLAPFWRAKMAPKSIKNR